MKSKDGNDGIDLLVAYYQHLLLQTLFPHNFIDLFFFSLYLLYLNDDDD